MADVQPRLSWWARAGLFSLASNAAVLLALSYGSYFWPEGLPGWAHHPFWVAGGVNVAGLLILGLDFWPVILLDAVLPSVLLGEPFEMGLLGSATNAMEALLAAWMIRRWGDFNGNLDRIRTVGVLLLASVVAPLTNTLIIPAYLCLRGLMPWVEYLKALGNWNMANGAGLLLVGPLVLAIYQRSWNLRGRAREALAMAVVAAVLCVVAFDAIFGGLGTKFAFLAFPLVIYAAVRFGAAEASAALGIMLMAIYVSLATHAHALPPERLAEMIWFVQAFCWAVAATGLMVAALSAERIKAEHRSLAAMLGEERARLAALRYQINPHFLFNALNSVRAEIPPAEERPREMVTELAGYLRATLDHPDTETATLREEVQLAENYLAIEKHRFGSALDVDFEVAPELLGRAVPVFLLQPLVENAIRHGLEASKGVFRLQVKAVAREGKVRIEVANSGRWREPGEKPGLGLANIRRRLELLYGEKAALGIVWDPGWVRIQIDLPAAS